MEGVGRLTNPRRAVNQHQRFAAALLVTRCTKPHLSPLNNSYRVRAAHWRVTGHTLLNNSYQSFALLHTHTFMFIVCVRIVFVVPPHIGDVNQCCDSSV